MAEALSKSLASQIQSLATGGDYKIPGLELKGKDAERNAMIYGALKGIAELKSIADMLKMGASKSDVAQLQNNIASAQSAIAKKINVEKSLSKYSSADKDAVLKIIDGYLGSIASRVDNLKKMEKPAVAEPAALAPETPEAPPMDGDVPQAPAMGNEIPEAPPV